MQYAEALREVKRAEAEVRDLKADAQKQAVQVLRDAERQANQLLDQARKQADEAYTNAIEVARVSAEKTRVQRLSAGEKDAAAVRARASGPDFKAALDALLANFEKHATTGK
jgi:vacuolar-type H+-ATPase subunit H